LINNSRGITFAYTRQPYQSRYVDRWQEAVLEAVNEMINDLAANTPAGKLRGNAAS
jgi:orotidine-5'-phosphate decarboxylase